MEGIRNNTTAKETALTSRSIPGRFHSARFISKGKQTFLRKPITVLHVHGRMARGGAEVRTLEIFRHVDRRRYRFHFCALSGLQGELDEEIRSLGGKVHLLRQSRIGFPRRFRDLLRRESIDVVHAHLHYYSGYLMRLAAECGVPFRVAHFRSSKTDVVPGPGRKALHGLLRLGIDRYAGDTTMRGWINRHATHVLGVSRWVLDNNWGPRWHDDPRCRVVYDGIEVEPFAAKPDGRAVRREFGLPDGVPLLIHIGRMAEPKNHPRLISIFSEFLQIQPDARLLLVGRTSSGKCTGPLEGKVRSRIAALRISDRVVFAGQRTDVARLLLAADVLVFPSLWEGLGDVVLEARAAGTPVLASDLPSICEIAGRLGGVERLSLDAPDTQWACAIRRAAACRPTESQRKAALESFAASVFTVQHCTQALCRIWEGSGAEYSEKGVSKDTSSQGGAADG